MTSFLSDDLKHNNFDVFEITDNVTLVNDFLSPDEVSTILSVIDETEDDAWEIEYTKNLKRFCLEKFGRDDVEQLVAEGKFEITQNWSDKNLNISDHPLYDKIYSRLNNIIAKSSPDLELSGFATIQRMQPGVELKSHTDQHTDPSIRYATILYINDDYVDGELFFENKGLDLRPKPGSLLIFPGNEEFEHGVRHVGNGPIRYVIVGFIKVKDFYKENKY